MKTTKSRDIRGEGVKVIKRNVDAAILLSDLSHELTSQMNRLKTDQHFTLTINKINQHNSSKNLGFRGLMAIIKVKEPVKDREASVIQCFQPINQELIIVSKKDPNLRNKSSSQWSLSRQN